MTSVIGSLLEDLEAGKSFADAKRAFDAKMRSVSLQDQRPAHDELARLAHMAATSAAPTPRSSLRGKLIGAIVVAGIGIGASVMSCVGQSFSLRQARAMEGIEQQLRQIQLQPSCPADRAMPVSR